MDAQDSIQISPHVPLEYNLVVSHPAQVGVHRNTRLDSRLRGKKSKLPYKLVQNAGSAPSLLVGYCVGTVESFNRGLSEPAEQMEKSDPEQAKTNQKERIFEIVEEPVCFGLNGELWHNRFVV